MRGTGSLESTRADASVTEVTVGSGLYAPGCSILFTFSACSIALLALQVTRPSHEWSRHVFGGGTSPPPRRARSTAAALLPAGMKLLDQRVREKFRLRESSCGNQTLHWRPRLLQARQSGELAELSRFFADARRNY